MQKILLALCALLTFQLGAMETSVPSLQQLTVKHLAENLEKYTPEQLENIPTFACKGLAYYWAQANPSVVNKIASTVTSRVYTTNAPRTLDKIEYSPNGEMIALNHKLSLQLVDTATLQLRHIQDNTNAFTFHPHTGELITADNNTLHLNNSHKCFSDQIDTIQCATNAKALLIATRGPTYLLNPDNLNEIKPIHTTPCFKSNSALTPNGERVIVGRYEKPTTVYDNEGTELYTLDDGDQYIAGIEVSPDGRTFGTRSHSIMGPTHGVKLFDVATGKPLTTLHPKNPRCFAFRPDGYYIATGSDANDGAIQIWNRRGDYVYSPSYPCDIRRIRWHPNKPQIAFSCASGNLHVVDLPQVLCTTLEDAFYNPYQLALISHLPALDKFYDGQSKNSKAGKRKALAQEIEAASSADAPAEAQHATKSRKPVPLPASRTTLEI